MSEIKTDVKRPNKPWLAFVLSFVLPGAGLAYLGMWRSAAGNLAVAFVLPAIILVLMPEDVIDSIHYLYLTIAVGSGAWAHATAARQNRTSE